MDSRKVVMPSLPHTDFPQKYRCILCKNLLQIPMQLPCGHHVCQTPCLDNLFTTADRTTCPKKEDADCMMHFCRNNVFKDMRVKKEISSMTEYRVSENNDLEEKKLMKGQCQKEKEDLRHLRGAFIEKIVENLELKYIYYKVKDLKCDLQRNYTDRVNHHNPITGTSLLFKEEILALRKDLKDTQEVLRAYGTIMDGANNGHDRSISMIAPAKL